jgi:hypothetical protein
LRTSAPQVDAVQRPRSSIATRRSHASLPFTNVGQAGLREASAGSASAQAAGKANTVLPGMSPALPPGRIRRTPF